MPPSSAPPSPPASSSLPINRPIRLPALDPPSSSTPSSSSPPVAFSIKLTDAQLSQLLSAPDPSLTFSSLVSGHISLSPSAPDPIPFTTRSTSDGDDAARCFLFSRSGTAVRRVGPVAGEMELDRRYSKRSAPTPPPQSARPSPRKLEMLDGIPPPAKKQRTRAPEKRPRGATSRPKPAPAKPRLNGSVVPRRISPDRKLPVNNGMGVLGRTPVGVRPIKRDRVDKNALRRDVVHVLALGTASMVSVRERVLGQSQGLSMETKDVFRVVLNEVGRNEKELWALKKDLWAEVDENYERYSTGERVKVKDERTKLRGKKDEMSEEELNRRLREFREHGKLEDTVIRNESDELRVRKWFKTWYPLYAGLVAELERFRATFLEYRRRLQAASSGSERDRVSSSVEEGFEKHSKRRKELVDVLTTLHGRLRKAREALGEWARG